MGIFDNLKSFVHSITTEDHYASFESPYRNSTIQNNASSSRLQELGRLATANSSTVSIDENGGNSGRNSSLGYRPGLRSSSTALNGSDVQLQQLGNNSQPPLPSIESIWSRIESWLEEEYPELEDNLNDGATTADLNEFENDLGCGSLPVEFRQFYKIHDGQIRGGEPAGLLLGLVLLDLESIGEEYKIWGNVSQRLEKQQYALLHQQQIPGQSSSSNTDKLNSNSFLANQKSLPPQSIQCVYVHRGWIPFAKDGEGNLIAIDVAPGPSGTWGQIILFGRQYDTKVVIAQSFQEFIFGFISDLEAGNFSIDDQEHNVDYGYLESSRNDDYYIGADDEGEGELSWYDRSGKEFSKGLGKISYMDVWRIRALRKLGIQNAESFRTQYVAPQKRRIPSSMSHNSTSVAGRAPSSSFGANSSNSRSTTPNSKSSTPLINIEAKETLIDETSKKIEKKSLAKPEMKNLSNSTTTKESITSPSTGNSKSESAPKEVNESKPIQNEENQPDSIQNKESTKTEPTSTGEKQLDSESGVEVTQDKKDVEESIAETADELKDVEI